ncbi:MAG: copper resistance protein NlpE N-terminal domain-containing protein [Desulfuromonadaceae bacterium]|nr:copper resistance protein NlpE N-terminal domain-containing protein [Desulfuromonadaceae bacterium]
MKRWFSKSGKIWMVLSALLCCCACSVVGEKPSAPITVDSHASMSALDWAGTYTGTLPCADCSGIETVLTLTQAHTYVLHSRYLGGQTDGEEIVRSGVFEWSQDGCCVELLGLKGGRSQYQVGENKLFALDQTGVRIEGALTEAYTLTKNATISVEDLTAAVDVFAGTAWCLVELQGEPLVEQESAAWLVFETDPERVYGFSGCNRFFGAYQLGSDPQQQVASTALPLRFDALGSTMMACPPAVMENEAEFLAMLGQVAGVCLEKMTDSEKETKEQKWWEGTSLVFVDSAHRVIARFDTAAEM